MENEKLAVELLRELKAQSKRWFYAFCIMCVIEAATIAGFLWYVSLPVEEISYSQNVESGDHNRSMQIIGGAEDGESETD